MRARKLLGASALLGLLAFAAAISGGACGGSGPSDQGRGGMTTTTSGATTTTDNCFPSPMTYVEIINACTTAQGVDVTPVLPLLLPDGGLPPLP